MSVSYIDLIFLWRCLYSLPHLCSISQFCATETIVSSLKVFYKLNSPNYPLAISTSLVLYKHFDMAHTASNGRFHGQYDIFSYILRTNNCSFQDLKLSDVLYIVLYASASGKQFKSLPE